MDILTENSIELIILFVAPGFISLKVWGLLNSSPRLRLSESLIEAVIFSSFNAIFFLWLFSILKPVHPILAYGVIFIVFPVLWPVGFYNLAKIPFFKTRLTPTALHLKNGQMLGGLYTAKSFASSFPEKEDLYLSELWNLAENGAFIAPVENSGGLLVNFEEVSFIEIFKLDFTPLTTIIH